MASIRFLSFLLYLAGVASAQQQEQFPLSLQPARAYVFKPAIDTNRTFPEANLKAVTWNGNGCPRRSNTTWSLDQSGIF
jgi:hypothetical protein